jgi:hypothetical protein
VVGGGDVVAFGLYAVGVALEMSACLDYGGDWVLVIGSW